jgi:transcriptional regulator with XRE-family HTH domain
MKFTAEFGKMLKQAREQQGVSQGELAKALGYSSPQYVSNYERGLCLPPMKKIKTIIKATNLDSQKVYEVLKNYYDEELKKLIF